MKKTFKITVGVFIVTICMLLCIVSSYKLTIDWQALQLKRLHSESELLKADLKFYREAYQEVQEKRK